MKTKYWRSPPTREAVFYLAYNLREADKLEATLLMPGKTMLQVLQESVDASDECWVEWANGTPIAIFGVGRSRTGETGCPWMVGTKDLLKHTLRLMREAKAWIARVRPRYVKFGNFVHASNTVHIKWLTHMGFTMLPPERLGRGWFHPFYME